MSNANTHMIERLTQALRPFAQSVHIDNGDVVFTYSGLSKENIYRARCAYDESISFSKIAKPGVDEITEAARNLATAILRELDVGGNDYFVFRSKIAALSEYPVMAVSTQEHLDVIKSRLTKLKIWEEA